MRIAWGPASKASWRVPSWRSRPTHVGWAGLSYGDLSLPPYVRMGALPDIYSTAGDIVLGLLPWVKVAEGAACLPSLPSGAEPVVG